MGNGSSQALEGQRRANWNSSTLPRDMTLRTPNMNAKRLPGLGEAATSGARLRSTDNGAILFSGGTISGRRPSQAGISATLPQPTAHDRMPRRPDRDQMLNGHMGVYRSRSVSSPDPTPSIDNNISDRMPRSSAITRRERDPLHRSHVQVDQYGIEENFAQPKKFGSEPNLGGAEEVTKSKIMKHFRKKYRAPPPPQMERDGSSPDSVNWKNGKRSDHPQPPSRKLRMFKTRAESKKQLQYDINSNGIPFSNAIDNRDPQQTEIITESSCYSSPERRFRTPSRERETYKPYSNHNSNMTQCQETFQKGKVSLPSKERAFCAPAQGNVKSRVNRQLQNSVESRFIPNITRAFRSSERFKKETEPVYTLRREKSFDVSLMESRHQEDTNGVNRTNNNRKKLLDQKQMSKPNDRFEERSKRMSMPQLTNNTSADDFQKELMVATNKIRNQFKRLSDERKVDQTSHVKKQLVNSSPDSKNLGNHNKNNRIANLQKKKESSRKEASESASQIKNRNIQNAVREKLLSKNKAIEKSNLNVKTLDVRRESRPFADRGQASGKESTPEQSPSRVKDDKLWDRDKHSPPSKQFYFGMDNEKEALSTKETPKFPGIGKPTLNYDERQFQENSPLSADAADINPKKYPAKIDATGSSESALSSEPEIDDRNSDETNPHGIDLKLRPTLPKKQLEIPRFSPAAAWKQLAALEAEQTDRVAANSVSEDSGCPPIINCEPSRLRSNHDKSGDSGISGDVPLDANHDDRLDSPNGDDFNPCPIRPRLPTWTPQQDLGEESSSDQGVDSPSNPPSDNTPAKFSARNPIFSLSLPRDAQHQNQAEKSKQQSFNSLQKLKKSVSGAFGALGSRKFDAEDDAEDQSHRNWFLSRSAPNSLNNGMQFNHRRLGAVTSNDSGNQQSPPSSDQEEERERLPSVIPSILRQQPQFSYLSSGGHVMYLPEYDSKLGHRQGSHEQPYSFSHAGQYKDRGFFATLDRLTEREDSFDNLDLKVNDAPRAFREDRLTRAKSSGEIELKSRKNVMYTNSCEDLSGEMMEIGERQDLQINNRKQDIMNKPAARSKGKRFTFQSTVRQIERRRLSEKLSREAEQKERQRLSELEAMRRVEEEFQRKRAREKASIRQQLRLVTGTVNGVIEDIPLNWDDQPRLEPDGEATATGDRQSPYVSRLAAMRSARTPNATGAGAGRTRAAPGHSDSGSEGGSRGRDLHAHHPPATKVLSEYKVSSEQPARQYRDYTSRLSGSSGGSGGTPPSNGSPSAVQHPPACYNMPRSTHVYVSAPPQGLGSGGSPTTADNYRLHFARGAAASSSGSGSEASGSRLAPRAQHQLHQLHQLHQQTPVAAVSGRLRVSEATVLEGPVEEPRGAPGHPDDPEIVPTILKSPPPAPPPVVRGELLKMR